MACTPKRMSVAAAVDDQVSQIGEGDDRSGAAECADDAQPAVAALKLLMDSSLRPDASTTVKATGPHYSLATIRGSAHPGRTDG